MAQINRKKNLKFHQIQFSSLAFSCTDFRVLDTKYWFWIFIGTLISDVTALCVLNIKCEKKKRNAIPINSFGNYVNKRTATNLMIIDAMQPINLHNCMMRINISEH